MRCTGRSAFRFKSGVVRGFAIVDEIVLGAAVHDKEKTLIM